jgi:hypothetical protein
MPGAIAWVDAEATPTMIYTLAAAHLTAELTLIMTSVSSVAFAPRNAAEMQLIWLMNQIVVVGVNADGLLKRMCLPKNDLPKS